MSHMELIPGTGNMVVRKKLTLGARFGEGLPDLLNMQMIPPLWQKVKRN